ncbi:hypothetical protein I79_021414 [Cricetulus griseus]|uniref:Uncharacterized protein n=1 Tax=Cricetulus griseus TaxID=10029 RepID=G3ICL6_CRIGR|nr:hypothetical protein I79_021414 [Cricetulus griseus]
MRRLTQWTFPSHGSGGHKAKIKVLAGSDPQQGSSWLRVGCLIFVLGHHKAEQSGGLLAL